jgi:hypothetical protein
MVGELATNPTSTGAWSQRHKAGTVRRWIRLDIRSARAREDANSFVEGLPRLPFYLHASKLGVIVHTSAHLNQGHPHI